MSERRYPAEQFEELLPELPAEPEPVPFQILPMIEGEELVERALRETLAKIAEQEGHGRNAAVHRVFLNRLAEGGASKAAMLAHERRVTEAINGASKHRDHEYNVGKTKGEFRRSVESRIKSGVKGPLPPPELTQIMEASQSIHLSEATRRVFNAVVIDSGKFGTLEVSKSARQGAIAASVCRNTEQGSIRKLIEVGLLVKVEEAKWGKSAIYRLQIPPSTASERQLQPLTTCLGGSTLSQQEIRLQSQFSSSFAFMGLSLRTFSALVCLDRFSTVEELADLLGIHPRTVRRRLARFARFGLVARVGKTFKALSANLSNKLRQAAKMLGTAWACERRKRLYEAESRQFELSRIRLSLQRRIDNLKAKIPTVKRGFRPFLRCRISDLTDEAIDVLIAPRPPTPAKG